MLLGFCLFGLGVIHGLDRLHRLCTKSENRKWQFVDRLHKHFCRNASLLDRPVEQKVPTPNTRKLFSRSASVLGRPRPTEPSRLVRPKYLLFFCNSDAPVFL